MHVETLEGRTLLATASFAVIGDYGKANAAEAAVAGLVRSWRPQFVVTTGDNDYSSPGQANYDRTVARYYSSFIGGYNGPYGRGPASNNFYPAMGNHDWDTRHGAAYTSFFRLPGNERYYDVVRGPVHFFIVSSDPREPGGLRSGSNQVNWLRSRLQASRSPWQIVITHHPPYSSGRNHGSSTNMRWSFKSWGADLVLSGHEHNYERIERSDGTYVVNGLGGASLYNFGPAIGGSSRRYNANHGAMRMTANDTELRWQFVNIRGQVVDSVTRRKTAARAPAGTPPGLDLSTPLFSVAAVSMRSIVRELQPADSDVLPSLRDESVVVMGADGPVPHSGVDAG